MWKPRIGTALMLSTPPAMITSAPPAMMRSLACAMLCKPEEQKRLLRGVIARAKIGLNEQGPMPIHLTVKIPLGTQGGVKDSSNLGSPADPLKRVEPAAYASGSTGRLQWCAGGDSNPDESYLASTSSLWR